MFDVISLALVTVATVLGVIAIGKFLTGAQQTNYQTLLTAQKLLGTATVLLGMRAALNIMVFSEERIAYAIMAFITSAIAYAIWKFALIPTFKKFAVPADQVAIEHQEIIDELNDQFLNPEKIINKDR